MFFTLLLMVNLEIASLKNIICQCSSSKLSCFSQVDQEIYQSSTKETFASTLSRCEETVYLSLVRLKNNQAETIISHNLSKIYLLHVSDCNKLRLKEGMFSTAENLLYLTLVRNKISQLKQKIFLGLTELQLLNLNNNRIRILIHHCFQDLSNLRELYLKKNQISLIAFGVFKDMRRLTILDLSSNRLSFVTNKTFHGLFSLEILILSGNKIKQFQGSLWKLAPSHQIFNKKVGGDETEESKIEIQDEEDGDLLSVLILFTIVTTLLALLTALVILRQRNRKVSQRSLFVLAEERDEEMAECLCAELRHLLPQITVLSCSDSTMPGQLKVRLTPTRPR